MPGADKVAKRAAGLAARNLRSQLLGLLGLSELCCEGKAELMDLYLHAKATVCQAEACQEKLRLSCPKRLPGCRHFCGGEWVCNEST